MISGTESARRGASIQLVRMDAISNNLANLGTAGFKRDTLSFDQVLGMTIKTDISEGDTRQTGNDLDLAIEGDGFFKVETPSGVRYTRNGRLSLNSEGVIVTPSGNPVLGDGGPITASGTNITVGQDGKVQVDGSDVGTFSLVHFGSPAKLKKEGDSNYTYEGADIETAEESTIKQGFIEEPNVNATEEMVQMMEIVRIFEACQKVISTIGDANGKLINDVGKP